MALLERFARGVPTGWGMGARLRVRPKLAIAIARETVVLSDHPRAVNALSARPLTGPSLCLEIVNDGRRPLVCAEVGLAGRFDAPRITMHEPMLHDSKGWPRRLDPGESVITYFGPGLANHPVLADMRRAWAHTTSGETWRGTGPALRYFVKDAVGRR